MDGKLDSSTGFKIHGTELLKVSNRAGSERMYTSFSPVAIAVHFAELRGSLPSISKSIIFSCFAAELGSPQW